MWELKKWKNTQVRHGLVKSDGPGEESPEKGLLLVLNDSTLCHSHLHLWWWFLRRLSKLPSTPTTILLNWLPSPRQSDFIMLLEFLLPTLENISSLSYLRRSQHPNPSLTSHQNGKFRGVWWNLKSMTLYATWTHNHKHNCRLSFCDSFPFDLSNKYFRAFLR